MLFGTALMGSDVVRADETVHCTSVNSCKGQSACKSANNACKGQNACKAQGFLEMSKKECKAARDKVKSGGGS